MNEPDYFRPKMGVLAASFGLIGMAVALLYSVLTPQKPISRNYADGTYRNRECGTISFRDGTAAFGSTSVPYSLEQRKDGVAAISAHLIAIERDNRGCRIVYDASRHPLYLAFGRDAPPTSVTLWDTTQNVAYAFVRTSK